MCRGVEKFQRKGISGFGDRFNQGEKEGRENFEARGSENMQPGETGRKTLLDTVPNEFLHPGVESF